MILNAITQSLALKAAWVREGRDSKLRPPSTLWKLRISTQEWLEVSVAAMGMAEKLQGLIRKRETGSVWGWCPWIFIYGATLISLLSFPFHTLAYGALYPSSAWLSTFHANDWNSTMCWLFIQNMSSKGSFQTSSPRLPNPHMTKGFEMRKSWLALYFSLCLALCFQNLYLLVCSPHMYLWSAAEIKDPQHEMLNAEIIRGIHISYVRCCLHTIFKENEV